MASVCLYFQIHQPFRLRRYSVFDSAPDYFDETANADICRRIASVCYRPANELMLRLCDRHAGQFRVAFSITGVALEQFDRYAPDVIESFRALACRPEVELLGETSHHSLAFLYSRGEFREQIELHRAALASRFNVRATTFRNTELVYSDELPRIVSELGFRACLAEGADQALVGRTANAVYHPPTPVDFRLLLRNYRLSDDITFRFDDQTWDKWPLTADRFADWLDGDPSANVNLFVDYESIGEHLSAEDGIFEFFEHLPAAVLARGHQFVTPAQLAARAPDAGELAVPNPTSWADTSRDLSAWLGNAMQQNAIEELYSLESAVKQSEDAQLLADWRWLQASDHFYYMSTKYFTDGDVHRYFSPYESPYDSYINFMNVLDNIRSRADA